MVLRHHTERVQSRVQVRAVARTGTFGAFERVAREANYMVLEAWQSAQYEDTVKYYVWDHVCVQPFTVNSNGKVSALETRPSDHF